MSRHQDSSCPQADAFASEPKIGRRQFLFSLTGGAFAISAAGVLAGCGGGSNGGSTYVPPITGTGFVASVNGAVQSATGGGVQPFQIGLASSTQGSAALNGTAGTFDITSSNHAGLPSGTLYFSLYATTANATSGTTAAYSGTYIIYQTSPNTPVSSGTFTANATFTDAYDATFTASFTATSGVTTYSPATLTNGSFTSTATPGNQNLSGTLNFS